MNLPNESKLFTNCQRDLDIRGEILSIVDAHIQNVSLITCIAGSIRSNHYHHNDYHFIYVLEGEIDYFYKNPRANDVKYLKVNTGDTIFTPNNELHATFFPINTRLIVSSRFPRDQETYEKDTVREKFITPENIYEMLQKYSING